MMIGVHAVIFSRNEVLGIGSDITIAAVAIVEVPVTAAGLLAGEAVDGDLVGIDDVDTAVEVVRVVGVFPQSIIVIRLSAFHVVVDGLRSLVVDRQGRIGTAVNAVAEDSGGQLAVAGHNNGVNVVSFILELHFVAGPVGGGSGSVPPVNAGIVLTVCSKVEIVEPRQSLGTFGDNELVMCRLNDIAGLGIELFGNMDINVLGRFGTCFAVRHLEIDFLHSAIIVFHRCFQRRSVVVYNIVGAERYGRQRENQHEG